MQKIKKAKEVMWGKLDIHKVKNKGCKVDFEMKMRREYNHI